MKDAFKVLVVFVSVVLVIILFTFALSAVGVVHLRIFAPQYEAAGRDVYENTPSYVQGKEQALAELRTEYRRAKDSGEKSNIRAMVVNEAATVNIELLKDSTLRTFVQDMRNGK